LPQWVKRDEGGRSLLLNVHVQPGARVSGPAGRHGDALKVRIAAPANGNRANEALIELLRGALRLPRSAVRITHGARSRRKLVAIDACDDALATRLRAWDTEQTPA
jgi:uncharacterized protein (TIGR00251 family)